MSYSKNSPTIYTGLPKINSFDSFACRVTLYILANPETRTNKYCKQNSFKAPILAR